MIIRRKRRADKDRVGCIECIMNGILTDDSVNSKSNPKEVEMTSNSHGYIKIR